MKREYELLKKRQSGNASSHQVTEEPPNFIDRLSSASPPRDALIVDEHEALGEFNLKSTEAITKSSSTQPSPTSLRLPQSYTSNSLYINDERVPSTSVTLISSLKQSLGTGPLHSPTIVPVHHALYQPAVTSSSESTTSRPNPIYFDEQRVPVSSLPTTVSLAPSPQPNTVHFNNFVPQYSTSRGADSSSPVEPLPTTGFTQHTNRYPSTLAAEENEVSALSYLQKGSQDRVTSSATNSDQRDKSSFLSVTYPLSSLASPSTSLYPSHKVHSSHTWETHTLAISLTNANYPDEHSFTHSHPFPSHAYPYSSHPSHNHHSFHPHKTHSPTNSVTNADKLDRISFYSETQPLPSHTHPSNSHPSHNLQSLHPHETHLLTSLHPSRTSEEQPVATISPSPRPTIFPSLEVFSRPGHLLPATPDTLGTHLIPPEGTEEPFRGVVNPAEYRCGDVGGAGVSFFVSPSYPGLDRGRGTCMLRLLVADPSVCQVRVDLIETVLAPPRDGRCEDQRIEVSGSIIASPVTHFCGTNTHLHFYVHLAGIRGRAASRWVDFIATSFTDAHPYRYKLRLTQVDCSARDPLQAPRGCLQYFLGAVGVIKSFNQGDGQYLQAQRYRACVRAEPTACSITLTAGPGHFGLCQPRDRAGVGVQACPEDYILLPEVTVGAAEATDLNVGVEGDLDSNMNVDGGEGEGGQRFCGGRLSYLNGDVFNRPITAHLKGSLYVITFRSGEHERQEDSTLGQGFRIFYRQSPACIASTHSSFSSASRESALSSLEDESPTSWTLKEPRDGHEIEVPKEILPSLKTSVLALSIEVPPEIPLPVKTQVSSLSAISTISHPIPDSPSSPPSPPISAASRFPL